MLLCNRISSQPVEYIFIFSTAILTEFDTIQNLKKLKKEMPGEHNSLSLTQEYVNSNKKSLMKIYIWQIFHPLQSFSSHFLLCCS